MNTPNTEQNTDLGLFEFPCRFPLKIMGATHPDFVPVVLSVVQAHAPETSTDDLTHRTSEKGNFISATITITATSRTQLDTIYHALTAHPMVKVVY